MVVTRIAARICMMALFVTAFAWGRPTLAQADDANKILKAMSDYLGSQKNFSASFDSDLEVITPQVEKIQFAAEFCPLSTRTSSAGYSATCSTRTSS